MISLVREISSLAMPCLAAFLRDLNQTLPGIFYFSIKPFVAKIPPSVLIPNAE